MKKNSPIIYSIIIFLIFEIIAFGLYLTTKNSFYLFNFTYIGSALAFAIYLTSINYKHSRLVSQLLLGSYMLVFLGIINKENMQLEGFWYYLFLGSFEAGLIHYLVAKIFGPLIFGRGWCGYACWTAMILDLLPYKSVHNTRVSKFNFLKYLLFIASFIFVASLFILKINNIDNIMFIAFIIGNILYYLIGIVLAYKLKDNRAFCKYICPITIFLKPMSYHAKIRIRFNEKTCINCNKCYQVCPMDVDMKSNSKNRVNSTECILCSECTKVCPTSSLDIK